MDVLEKQRLEILAARVRLAVVEGTYHAKSGHPGGSLSIADTLAYLYGKEMHIRPTEPQWNARDRFVLSKGHAAPALYGILALCGYFPIDLIPTLRHIDSPLQGHPDMKSVPGVDMSTGSLGQGVSAAVGMALSGKLSQMAYRVYTILGDGELEEGQVWEAAMFAAHKQLDNLCVIVDNNNLQIDGSLQEVNSPDPIPEKFAAFGFAVIETDAHDFDSMDAAFSKAKTVKGRPTAIIQKSIKGKGVSFMENQVGWHGKAPAAEEYEIAVAELKARLAMMEEGTL